MLIFFKTIKSFNYFWKIKFNKIDLNYEAIP